MTFDHVATQVPDIATAIAWYRTLFPDAEVLYQDATWAMIVAGGLRLAFVLPGHHPPHLAWRVPPEELDALAAERGAEVREHRDGSRSIYITGPSGGAIEIVAFTQV